jgi:hypothetical protein
MWREIRAPNETCRRPRVRGALFVRAAGRLPHGHGDGAGKALEEQERNKVTNLAGYLLFCASVTSPSPATLEPWNPID